VLVRPLPELLKDNARVHGDKVAYEDDSQAVTWRDLEARTARLAAGLGVGRGDRVAVLLGDGVPIVEALLAVTRAAAVGVLISHTARTRNWRVCSPTAHRPWS
jgi:acyl-CoA synthetase (AMP-forming)/AMP-acid ligase II